MFDFLRRVGGRPLVAIIAFGAALLPCTLLPFSLDATAGDPVVFRHPFDDGVLEVRSAAEGQITDAMRTFYDTGRDPYVGEPVAMARGKDLYENWCKGCHMPDGAGGMGPSLVDDVFIYERVPTDIGLFEVVFAGAGGAMQSFARRMSQDEMLKVVAYVRNLQKH